MRLFGFSRRRSETLLLAIAQLVLIAYVFQVAAFDHWDLDPGRDVAGVAGTSDHAFHAEHCHGISSSCADAGGSAVNISPYQAVRLPSPSPSLVLAADASVLPLQDALIDIAPEPPRAA